MNRNSKFEGFPKVLAHKQNKIQKNNIFVIFMFDSRGRTAYNPQTVAARWRICPNLQGDVDMISKQIWTRFLTMLVYERDSWAAVSIDVVLCTHSLGLTNSNESL